MTTFRGNRSRLLAGMLLLLVSCTGPTEKDAVHVQPAAAPAGPATFADIAKRVARPAGFPRPSAVCFSSRWKHPSNDKDPHDTFKAAAGFHATGFYWANGPNKEWFMEIRRRGYPFQGWLSTILPDTLFGRTLQKGRIMNEKGELVTGPWMLSWKGWWGCLNSPEYRAVYLEYVKMYLDAGADSLQMDDPGENFTAARWGGCYCKYCKEKAARLGKSPKDIQRESTEEFYKYIRAEMDAYARRHVPFSCNSHPGDPCFFDCAFDFGLEELDEARPCIFHSAIRDAESRGKAQMYTFRSTSVPATRRAIALAYACGSHILVPWDVYIPNPPPPRYFGKPEDYADLYGFARANAAYLDGYEDAAFLMPQIADDRWDRPPLAVSGGSPNLNLFVRAIPRDRDAPVVIHCLDTDDSPRPFRLRVNPTRLFGDRPVTMDLLVPAPYDAAAHERAEQTKDFAPLSVKKRLAAGYVADVEVPALSPWGLVVISPDAAAAKGIWPPFVTADGTSAYTGSLSVRMESVKSGALIRYTTDGTEPGASSAEYCKPFSITADTTVKARSFVKDAASAAATVSFRRVGKVRTPTPPGALAGLRLWLRADDLLPSHKPGDFIARWPAKAGPDMVAEKVALCDGRTASAPVIEKDAINHLPAVRFKSGADLLVIRRFADEYLRGAFTIFTVTQARDKLFGACGNSLNGNGGTPRLYLMRVQFTYNASSIGAGASPNRPALLTFAHDGVKTISAYLDGARTAMASGPEYAPVSRFGSGGNFAIPFWCGNEYHGGDIAEVIVFDRRLNDSEREGIEQYLAEKYGLRTVKTWE